jgi:DNA excision repair protein ERCC-3
MQKGEGPVGYFPENPLIVQSDRTVLLEVNNPRYEEGRDLLSLFAELVKSPEHIHTYAITPLSLWNAAATGLDAAAVLEGLERLAKYPVPQSLKQEITDQMARYGRVKLVRGADGALLLQADEPLLLTEIWHQKAIRPLLLAERPDGLVVDPAARGQLKQAMVKIGYPVEDGAGYQTGAPLPIRLRPVTLGGRPFNLRPYQDQAVRAFYKEGSVFGGSGVIVLPCGAGKTIVGIGAMAAVEQQTLILTTNVTAVRQWIQELLDKTYLTPDQVGEYTGEVKEIRPVTVSTYQMLTHRSTQGERPTHLTLLGARPWGLIIYDEVHTLPAPIFRATAEIQALRRLGLTATLVREDGRETDVFSLIGPKRYEVPWRVLEQAGYIATATCTEIRVPLADDLRLAYATADERAKYRIAAENPAKDEIISAIIARHPGEQVLVIGQYLDQLMRIAARLGAPLITGRTPNVERDELYAGFKQGAIPVLVVSKVANFAVDLPDASVAIQVSGTFGSRQEEAQRLGRVLRPKREGQPASFYALVTRETRDQEFALKRQLFLTEQGYQYEIMHAESFLGGEPVGAPAP